MNKRVLILLLVAAIDRIILQGIYPVLPVMVAGMGASKKDTGIFMTLTYIAIALGSIYTPRILRRYPSVNKLSIIIAVLTAAALLAMGMQTGYWGLLVATACYWCLSGIQINIYSVIMSYISTAENVAVNFGLLANMTLVGAVAGSFLIGPLIHYCGNYYAFLMFGIASIAARLVMMLSDYDVVYAQHPPGGHFKLSKRLWVLLISFNTGMMLSFIGRFNLSLIMKELHYGLDQVSYIFAWGSLLVFPLPYVFARLSRRVPGKLLLMFTLLCATSAMYLLYSGASYTAFLSVSFLICIMTYCSRGVSQKMIYDMYPINQQTQAQSVLTSANWVAAIAGFVFVSATADVFSLQQVSLFGFVLGLLSVGLLMGSRVSESSRYR